MTTQMISHFNDATPARNGLVGPVDTLARRCAR